MSVRECTWCSYLRSLYAENVAMHLQNYVEHIPKELKCGDEDYSKRLAICEKCTQITNGMCAVCGCFVAARAAKAKQYCPLPGNSKW